MNEEQKAVGDTEEIQEIQEIQVIQEPMAERRSAEVDLAATEFRKSGASAAGRGTGH